MNEYETIIGKYFKERFLLEQCRYKMYCEEDIYNRIPQLIYRLSNSVESQEIYNMIKKCVENDKLKNAVNEIYRPGASVGDGELVGGVSSYKKNYMDYRAIGKV